MKRITLLLALLFASSGFAAVAPSFAVTANADGTLRLLPNGVAVQAGNSVPITFDAGTGTLPTILTNSVIRQGQVDATSNGFESVGWAGTAYQLSGRATGGTRASPTATTDGLTFFSLRGLGYESGYKTAAAGQFQMRADGLWTGSNFGTYYEWLGTPNGSTTAATWLTLRNGKLTTRAPTTTAAGFNLPHGTAPTSPVNGDVWTTTAGLYAYVNGSTVGPFGAGGGTAGNPTASAGLTAVNGVASTYMRSDGAPAINQAIVPTWTGVHTFDLGTGALPSSISASVATRASAGDTVGVATEGISFGASSGYVLIGRLTGGTRAAQTATADTGTLVGMQGYGYGTALTTTNPARFYINADGLWSGTNNGSYFLWSATPNGSTTRADWMKLQNGSLQLLAGGFRSTGADIWDANAMAALAVDVTKKLNTKTIAIDSSLTFSATPAVANTYFTLRLTNSDTNPHVITIPSTFDSNSQQTITSFNILAGGVETVTWCYDGTNYIAYGVPTSGSSAEVTVASATTTAIGAASSVNVAISGTTTITGLGTIGAGTYRVGRFTGALTFTHNASSLILPNGGSNITTVAGDTFGARSEGSGNWRVLWYQRATPAGGTGTVTATGGNLTANAVVLGAGTVDTKVAAGITTDGTSKLTLGVAGSSVGSVDFKNATSGTATLAPPTGALGTFQVTLPNAASTLPIFGQQVTFAGPTAARTVTLPDAAFTVARTDAANTFTGVQTFSTVIAGTSGGTGVNNSTRTMTYAGNVAFTGAFNVSFTVPGAFTYVLPAAADTLVGRTSTDTLTNKRVTARTNTTASSATPAINTDTTDEFTITALATGVTSFTTSLTGTPANGDQLLIRIKDNGTAQTLAFGASFRSCGPTLPTTTVLGKTLYILCIWNSTDSIFDVVSTSQQP